MTCILPIIVRPLQPQPLNISLKDFLGWFKVQLVKKETVIGEVNPQNFDGFLISIVSKYKLFDALFLSRMLPFCLG